MTETFLSPEDLAELLKVPIATVYRWNHTGQAPPFIKVGKHVRYKASDVEAWITSRAAATA